MGELKTKVYLCDAGEIAEGHARGFDTESRGQDTLFVVRLKGHLSAWVNSCPHIEGAPMAWKRNAYINAAKTHIMCSSHGALFESEAGLCIRGPCLGKFLQPVKLIENERGALFACQ